MRSLTIVCLLLFDLGLQAQNRTADSLRNLLKGASHDTSRLNYICLLIDLVGNDESRILQNEMKCLVEKNLSVKNSELLERTYLKYLAYSFTCNGKLLSDEGKIQEALLWHEKALKLFNDIGLKDGICNSYNCMAMIYQKTGDIAKAFKYLDQALKLSQELNDKQGIAAVLCNIGSNYSQLGDYDNALLYYTRSLKILEEIRDETGIPYAILNIGHVLELKGERKKALDYFQKVLLQLENSDDNLVLSTVYTNLGWNYCKQDSFGKALAYFKKSLAVCEAAQDKYGIAHSLNDIGSVYEKQNKFNEAISYGMKSLEMAKELGFPQEIQNGAGLMFKIYQKMGKYQEALRMYGIHISARDSANNQEARKAALSRQFQHEYEMKALADSLRIADERKINDLELLRQKADKRNLMIFSLSSIVVIVILLLLAIYFKKLNNRIKQNNEDLVRKNIEIEQKKEEINKQAVQIARYQSQMNPHFIFNAINGLQSTVLEEDKLAAIGQIQSLSKLLRLTLKNSENEYISISDERSYLEKYIEFELQRFTKKFEFQFIVDASINDQTLIPSMLIQPIIENSIKHAGLNDIAGEIRVEIKRLELNGNKLLKILVKDNGKGIAPKPASQSSGHESKGLEITKKRIDLEFRKHQIIPENVFTMGSRSVENKAAKGTETVMIIPFYEQSSPSGTI